MPCSPLKIDVSEERVGFVFEEYDQQETIMKQVASGTTSLILNGINNAISQKIEFFITAAIRTTKPWQYLSRYKSSLKFEDF
jgi:hypothetical protein